MPRLRILTLQLPAELQGAVADAAATLSAPVIAADLPEDLPLADRETLDLLVAGSNAAGLAAWTDAEELPRWIVLSLAPSPDDGSEALATEDFVPARLLRLFRGAGRRLELQRDNLRLRGDLQTIARRYRHDLVAPVGSIHTSASVIESPPHEAATTALMVQNVSESAREISTLIGRVSEVLRAIAEPKERVAFEMGPLVAAALARLAPEIERREARISLPASWPAVVGVSAWVELVWLNLIRNALAFGGPQPIVRLSAEAAGGDVVFSVADRGKGVPEKQIPVLFRPFHLLHRSISPGLGLAIVDRLLAMQGGRCSYRRDGEWTTFRFQLPARGNDESMRFVPSQGLGMPPDPDPGHRP